MSIRCNERGPRTVSNTSCLLTIIVVMNRSRRHSQPSHAHSHREVGQQTPIFLCRSSACLRTMPYSRSPVMLSSPSHCCPRHRATSKSFSGRRLAASTASTLGQPKFDRSSFPTALIHWACYWMVQDKKGGRRFTKTSPSGWVPPRRGFPNPHDRPRVELPLWCKTRV